MAGARLTSPASAGPDPGDGDIDGGLARRAVEGDAAAFRAIFDRHGPAIRRYLGDLLRDPAGADEATQETFVRAHRQLASLRTGDRLLPWLLGIARNVRHETTRALRRSGRSTAEPHDTRLPDDRITAELVDPGPSPEAILLGQEADRVLHEALAALAVERRAALLLSIDHGLAYEEIAAHMGWPLHKVKNEIHRARQTLRASLAPYLRGAP